MTSESVARFLRRHCEERLSAETHRAKAEATKQSIGPQRKLDCFVARAPRNDDDTCLRNPAARSARVLPEFPVPLISEGAGNAGRPMRPKPRVRNKTKHTSVVTTV